MKWKAGALTIRKSTRAFPIDDGLSTEKKVMMMSCRPEELTIEEEERWSMADVEDIDSSDDDNEERAILGVKPEETEEDRESCSWNAKRVLHRNLQSNRIAVAERAISRDKRTSSVDKIDKIIRVPTGHRTGILEATERWKMMRTRYMVRRNTRDEIYGA